MDNQQQITASIAVMTIIISIGIVYIPYLYKQESANSRIRLEKLYSKLFNKLQNYFFQYSRFYQEEAFINTFAEVRNLVSKQFDMADPKLYLLIKNFENEENHNKKIILFNKISRNIINQYSKLRKVTYGFALSQGYRNQNNFYTSNFERILVWTKIIIVNVFIFLSSLSFLILFILVEIKILGAIIS